MKHNNKGQVTVFIIVGILVIALLAIGIYYRSSIKNIITRQNAAEAGIFTQNTGVVETYITNCLTETATTGIDLLGSQGGFIEIPSDEQAVSATNVLSNSLTVLPGLYVPYWYYKTSNGIAKNQVPTRSSMEKELQTYIDDNLDACINHFEGFNPLVITAGVPKSSVTINNNNVNVKLNYPVQVAQENFTTSLSTFSTSIDVPLGDLYDSAVSIMKKENQDTFLEEKTLDQFVVYDELPYSGVDFSCTPRTWDRVQVYSDLKNILEANIAHLKAKGSDYTIDSSQKYYEIPGIDTNKDQHVQFTYSQDWPLLVDVSSDEPILKGESYNDNVLGQFITQFFCLNYYNFVYDLQYPVLISLSDVNTGYTFQFATQVVIDNNQARDAVLGENYLTEVDSNVCKYPVTPLSINVQGYDKNGRVVDLPNAKVSLQCVGTTCPLGTTKAATNTIMAPACLNANVIAEHDGYFRATQIVTTTDEQSLNFILEPKKILNLTVRVINADNGAERNVIKDETILIQFINTDDDYTTSALYPNQQTITLIPGTYDVRTTVLYSSPKGFSLKSETTETCFDQPAGGVLGVLGITKKKCQKTELKGITLDTVISGGTYQTTTISRDTLLSSSKITVPTIRNTTPEKVTDLQNIYKQIQTNKDNQYLSEVRLSE